MEILFKIIYDFGIYLVPLALLLYIIALINLPVTNYFFISTKDRGFQISKLFGLILISYIYFTLVSLDSLINISIFRLNSFISISSSVAINVILNFIILKKIWRVSFYKYYENLFLEKRKDLVGFKKIFMDERVFILLIIFFYFINAFERGITFTSEQVMHYMIIENLRNTENLPLKDPEFSGEFFNYYYFGHFIFFTLISFLPFSFEYSYILLLILIPSLVGSLFLQLVRDINATYFIENQYKFPKEVALIISFVILYCFYTFTFNTVLFNQGTSYNVNTDDFLKRVGRPISNVLTENFSVSVTYAVLHAHFIGLLLSLLFLRILYQVLIYKIEFKVLNKFFILLGFLLGLMLMTNAADFAIYFVLMIIVISTYQFKFFLSNIRYFFKNIILFMYLPAITVILWKLNVYSPGGMIDFVRNNSALDQFLSFWGSYILLLLIIFVGIFEKYSIAKIHYPIILILYSFLLLFFLEVFYLKDAASNGNNYRFNTYHKFSNQVLLFLTLSLGIFIVPFWKKANNFLKTIFIIVCIFYSTLMVFRFYDLLINKTFTGITDVHQNSLFFKNNPHDWEFFQFIKDNKFKDKVFLEYNSEGYSEPHYSVLLGGRTTFIGYLSHEYFWRGDWRVIYHRIDIVNEIFLGDNLEKSKNLLSENKIDYIVVSNWAEESIKNGKIFNHNNIDYPVPHSIKMEKLLKLGKIVFENQNIKLIEVNK